MSRETDLKNAEYKQQILDYLSKADNKRISLAEFDKFMNQFEDKYDLKDELVEENFIEYYHPTDVMQITDAGIKILREYTYLELYKGDVAEEERQADLKRKQEEIIEFNHKLASMNLANYVSDRWKFSIPIAISLLALGISIWNHYSK